MTHNIVVNGGTSVRLPTAGKYCDRDITITAIGGGGTSTPTQEKTVDITENGTVEVTPDDGYALSKVTANVNVPSSGGGDDAEVEAFVGLFDYTTTVFESDRITKLGQYAFAYRDCTSISLPNLKTTAARVFTNCDNMTSLSIPNMTGATNTYMAAYCSAMKTVDVKQASSVSTYSFYGCANLTKIEFNRITSISTNAFNGCTKLATLIIRSSSMATLGGTSAFTGTKIAGGTGYVYVPKAIIDSYKAASNWSTYANQFRAIEDYPDICG